MRDSAASVFLVLVNVRYSLGTDNRLPAHRQWAVKIVAFDSWSAQMGAMRWAEQQIPDGIPENANRFANCAETIDKIAGVDCIGDSILRGLQSANAANPQTVETPEGSANTK